MKQYITKERLLEIEEKLKELKGNRKKILEKLKIARDFGDLSENEEYNVARKRQGENESKIRELEYTLKNYEFIDKNKISNEVCIGSTVVLFDLENKENIRYEITGVNESDVFKNKISNISAIGKSLMGKKEGDEVSIELPVGLKKYSIKSIE